MNREEEEQFHKFYCSDKIKQVKSENGREREKEKREATVDAVIPNVLLFKLWRNSNRWLFRAYRHHWREIVNAIQDHFHFNRSMSLNEWSGNESNFVIISHVSSLHNLWWHSFMSFLLFSSALIEKNEMTMMMMVVMTKTTESSSTGKSTSADTLTSLVTFVIRFVLSL